METPTQQISDEDALIKRSTEEAYDNGKSAYKSKRSWNCQKIPQYQLPQYLKNDPVLFQFFRRLHYQDKNFIALVVGDPGSGKSCSAISLARALDITPLGDGGFKKNFIIKEGPDGKGTPETRVVFGPSQFMQLVKQGLPKGSIIIWDEAGIGQDATQWNDKKSRLIKHVMQTFRSRNYGLLMTVPDKESVTLSTRRLVHCYIDVSKRDDNFAYLDIRWLNRVRGSEKTQTYYKFPIFRDPMTGKLKKVVKYKVPRLDSSIESVYNKIKDNTLQDIYNYYQKELEFMEKELGEKSNTMGANTSIKLVKFNMATAAKISKTEMQNILNNDMSINPAKIMYVLAEKGLDCNNTQAKLVADVLKNDKEYTDYLNL